MVMYRLENQLKPSLVDTFLQTQHDKTMMGSSTRTLPLASMAVELLPLAAGRDD